MLLGSVPCDSCGRLSFVWTPSVRSMGWPNRPQNNSLCTITLGNLCTSLYGNIGENVMLKNTNFVLFFRIGIKFVT